MGPLNWRPSVAFLILCCLLVVYCQTSNRPHIILIVADDLGWDDVSFHGSEISTPNIDSLASKGIILNNYYVQPICTPTRSTLMTGRYPIHTGLQHSVIHSAEPFGLCPNETIMPQYLKTLGYSTHIVGKWHLGFFHSDYLPTNRGFDSHFGSYGALGDYFNHHSNDTFWGLDLWRNHRPVWNCNGSYSTDLYSAEAERIIQSHDTSKPLFLYLANQGVHVGNSPDLFQAPEKYIKQFPNIENESRRIFAGMVSALDDSVGRVTKALNESGLLNNSIIVFTTDNGGRANSFDGGVSCNYPLRGAKNTVWEGGIRGTGFVYSNLLKKTSYTSNKMMHVSDWLPTLYYAAGGLSSMVGIDGYNMWETLNTDGESVRNEILHNIDPIQEFSAMRYRDHKIVMGQISVNGNHKDGWYCTPSSGDVKNRDRRTVNPLTGITPVIVDCKIPSKGTSSCLPLNAPCLFNVTADPCEYDNIASKNPEIVQFLLQKLEDYRKTAVTPRNKAADPRSNPDLHGGVWSPWIF